jgi:HAE1 family hydrophobic/amphiphilic exporter-1
MKALIERPVAVAMIYLAVLVVGVYSYLNIPLELAPTEDFPQVSVFALWQGAPPESVQSQVTAPIEEAVSAVKAVRKVSSSSRIGSSEVKIEFDPKADMEFVLLALREELSKLNRVLPYGVRPTIQRFVPPEIKTSIFMRYTVSGDLPLQALRALVKEKIEFGLGAVKGVAQVEWTGGSEPEIRLVLDKAKLKAYYLQPFQISQAVQNRLKTYPSGRILDGTQEIIFKYTDTIRDRNELGETIVGYTGANVLRVRDVAAIETSFADIQGIHRINGRSTASFMLYKEAGKSSLQVSRAVKAKLERIKKELPAGLIFKTRDDEGEEIQKKLRDLYRLAGIITVIVFLMVFVVLRRIKPSLLILTSIAFSVVITFNLLYFFKISLNMLTLGALALGFGMFVDNSIVVFENILRLRESGVSAKDALLQGPREVFVPVVASTLTTVAVFFSFPFFQGRLKMYYLPLAIVITSALMASLLVSFTLIPALSPRLIDKRQGGKVRKTSPAFGRFLRLCIRRPLELILVVAVLLFGSYKWFKAEVSTGGFFNPYGRNYLYVSLTMPEGTEIERTDAAIKAFEDKVMENPAEKEMDANVTATRASLRISFPLAVEQSYVPYAMKEDLIQLATQYAGVSVSISGFDPQGYYSSMSVGSWLSSRIKFYGYNLKKLKDITSELERTLRRNPRIKEVRIVSSQWGWYGDSQENILKIDKAKLRAYDIDPAYLYFHLQTVIRGRFGSPARIRTGGKEIAVSIKFPDAETLDIRGLKETLIRTRGGENQQFQQTVSWDFRGPAKAEERYRKGLFATLHLPAGFSAVLDEPYLMTREEQTQINWAILISLVLIFMIIAALFESLIQPFFIMMAVPLGLIGVFVAFVIAKAPFDSTAWIGVILLGGIVVNNAILLVDHINLKRKQGMPLLEAVVEGARERIRPIIMTTGTTVFGILPMLLISAESGQREIWASLALCTAGGLVTSTMFLLIVVPVIYFHGDRLRLWASAKWSELRLHKM